MRDSNQGESEYDDQTVVWETSSDDEESELVDSESEEDCSADEESEVLER